MSRDTQARLAQMANQIARNMVAMGGDVPAAVADHVESFWDPRMKAAIFADRSGLDPIAAAAIDLLAAKAVPPPQGRATKFGADRCDAG